MCAYEGHLCGRDECSNMRYTAGFLMRRGETGGRPGDCVGVDLPISEGTMRRAREGDEGRDGCAHVTVHVCARTRLHLSWRLCVR